MFAIEIVDKPFLRRVCCASILFAIASLSLLMTYRYFLEKGLLIIYYSIFYLFGIMFVIYLCYGILSRHKELKLIVYISPILLIIAMICDGIAHVYWFYDDAIYFFIPLRIDIISHFLIGLALFPLCVLGLSFFKFKYRIENSAFIMANVLLFMWELCEEIVDYTSLILYLKTDPNPFFWNSVQDIIMNLIVTTLSYILLKRYLVTRFPLILFIQ